MQMENLEMLSQEERLLKVEKLVKHQISRVEKILESSLARTATLISQQMERAEIHLKKQTIQENQRPTNQELSGSDQQVLSSRDRKNTIEHVVKNNSSFGTKNNGKEGIPIDIKTFKTVGTNTEGRVKILSPSISDEEKFHEEKNNNSKIYSAEKKRQQFASLKTLKTDYHRITESQEKSKMNMSSDEPRTDFLSSESTNDNLLEHDSETHSGPLVTVQSVEGLLFTEVTESSPRKSRPKKRSKKGKISVSDDISASSMKGLDSQSVGSDCSMSEKPVSQLVYEVQGSGENISLCGAEKLNLEEKTSNSSGHNDHSESIPEKKSLEGNNSSIRKPVPQLVKEIRESDTSDSEHTLQTRNTETDSSQSEKPVSQLLVVTQICADSCSLKNDNKSFTHNESKKLSRRRSKENLSPKTSVSQLNVVNQRSNSKSKSPKIRHERNGMDSNRENCLSDKVASQLEVQHGSQELSLCNRQNADNASSSSVSHCHELEGEFLKKPSQRRHVRRNSQNSSWKYNNPRDTNSLRKVHSVEDQNFQDSSLIHNISLSEPLPGTIITLQSFTDSLYLNDPGEMTNSDESKYNNKQNVSSQNSDERSPISEDLSRKEQSTEFNSKSKTANPNELSNIKDSNLKISNDNGKATDSSNAPKDSIPVKDHNKTTAEAKLKLKRKEKESSLANLTSSQEQLKPKENDSQEHIEQNITEQATLEDSSVTGRSFEDKYHKVVSTLEWHLNDSAPMRTSQKLEPLTPPAALAANIVRFPAEEVSYPDSDRETRSWSYDISSANIDDLSSHNCSEPIRRIVGRRTMMLTGARILTYQINTNTTAHQGNENTSYRVKTKSKEARVKGESKEFSGQESMRNTKSTLKMCNSCSNSTDDGRIGSHESSGASILRQCLTSTDEDDNTSNLEVLDSSFYDRNNQRPSSFVENTQSDNTELSFSEESLTLDSNIPSKENHVSMKGNLMNGHQTSSNNHQDISDMESVLQKDSVLLNTNIIEVGNTIDCTECGQGCDTSVTNQKQESLVDDAEVKGTKKLSSSMTRAVTRLDYASDSSVSVPLSLDYYSDIVTPVTSLRYLIDEWSEPTGNPFQEKRNKKRLNRKKHPLELLGPQTADGTRARRTSTPRGESYNPRSFDESNVSGYVEDLSSSVLQYPNINQDTTLGTSRDISIGISTSTGKISDEKPREVLFSSNLEVSYRSSLNLRNPKDFTNSGKPLEDNPESCADSTYSTYSNICDSSKNCSRRDLPDDNSTHIDDVTTTEDVASSILPDDLEEGTDVEEEIEEDDVSEVTDILGTSAETFTRIENPNYKLSADA